MRVRSSFFIAAVVSLLLTAQPSRLAAEDDGITDPSDTPQRRRNQIAMCRAIVASPAASSSSAELAANCKKLLAKFNGEWDSFEHADPANKEKKTCAALAKGGNLGLLKPDDQARCRKLLGD